MKNGFGNTDPVTANALHEAAALAQPDMTEEEIIARMNEDIARVNKLLPGYKRLQDLYLTTEAFEINSTRKVIRQKVIDRYYASIR